MSCQACAMINCFVPPPLQPGPTSDAAWCVCSACRCSSPHRRFVADTYTEITPLVKKTFIRMLASAQNPAQIDPARMRVYMEIRLRGCETIIACYNAFQRTADGYLGFYWDSQFTGACAGLYVGDVYVECEYCFSIRFRIRPCSLVVDSIYNEMALEDCGFGECSMLETVGTGVVGGWQCEESPVATECGLPAPYFESMDPPVPIAATQGCNLSCTPAFQIAGDDIVGSI